jgi:hypothetical protein
MTEVGDVGLVVVVVVEEVCRAPSCCSGEEGG